MPNQQIVWQTLDRGTVGPSPKSPDYRQYRLFGACCTEHHVVQKTTT